MKEVFYNSIYVSDFFIERNKIIINIFLNRLFPR